MNALSAAILFRLQCPGPDRHLPPNLFVNNKQRGLAILQTIKEM